VEALEMPALLRGKVQTGGYVVLSPIVQATMDTYTRECNQQHRGTECSGKFGFPTQENWLDGWQRCPVCEQVSDLDAEDRNFAIAMLLAWLERVDNRTDGWGGLSL
jgi:hypothetical protein